MSVAGLSAALLLLFFAGWGITLLLVNRSRPLHLFEFFALAWFFGAGTISLLLWVGGIFASGIALQASVTGCALACGFLGLRRAAKFRLPWPDTFLEWLLAVILLIELTLMLLSSLGRPLGWDGSFNWELKARFAFLNHGVMPSAYYHSASQVSSHPEYPLFVPYTQLWLDLWMGEAHQFWEKIVFPIFNLAGTLLLAFFDARLSGRRWVGGLVACQLLTIPYLAGGVGGMLSGYLDFPLAALYLAAIGYLLLYQKTGDEASYRIYVAALCLLPWMKREGLVLWFIAVLCGSVVLIQQRARVARFAALLLPGLLIILLWQLFLKSAGTAPSHDFVPASLATLRTNLSHLVPIGRAVFAEFGEISRWSIFWFLVLVALATEFIRQRNTQCLLLGTALVTPIAVYSATYLLSAWPDYLNHLHASLPRLLLQVTPLGWLAIALALARPSAETELVPPQTARALANSKLRPAWRPPTAPVKH
ncbi:MAG: hypothetical protein ACR2MW_11460 [Chthoniobacterales bacterium]